MCLSRIDRYTAVSIGMAALSYSVGALGAFAVYKFADMSVKLVILAFMVGQIFVLNVFFSCYRSPVVSVPNESPGITPEDSPQREPGHQREGMRRSQELSPSKAKDPDTSSS